MLHLARLSNVSDTPSAESSLLAPRHWPTWAALGALRAVTWLPFPVALAIGRALGNIAYWLAPRRRRIARINIDLCFPERDARERQVLVRRHFASIGMGVIETAMSWWAPTEKILRQVEWAGLEHFEAARAQGQGVMLVGAHFTDLEIAGQPLAARMDLHVMYRPHENPVIERAMSASRTRRYGKAIPRHDTRGLLRSLREKHVVWYASDQNYGHKGSVFAPFFGIPAATNTSTSRIARLTGAPVVPFFSARLPGSSRYLLEFQPVLDDFPSDDVGADATRINGLIEGFARRFPEQYLWVNRRFKDRPDDGPRFY
ncbi:lipid A biosynthesis lauroyl acyltransferase [Acidihalobacter yilgarnensis]|uniref:Lipid A biosynthesis acyltransferase n=1 Tax=Acidihalobacter yilgarnensis TaxID=2819280 RepID=A0A1D8IKT0_9GAMM|nr:lipid A biosynthesis lauroyl acyltransferase [Acidihalobacter yilgarnensis]